MKQVSDHLGSLRAVTNAAGGRIELRTYRGYGEMTTFSSNTLPQEDHGWIGERLDAGAELMHLNARYHDPRLGMFVSPDWFDVTEPGVGTNRYAYASGDPINVSDPGGNCPSCVGAALGALGGLAVQAVSDLVHGELSSSRDYAASAFAGAVGGATFGFGTAGAGALTVGRAVFAGGASGEFATVTDSVVRSGTMPSVTQQAFGTALGAAGGGLVGRAGTTGRTVAAANVGAPASSAAQSARLADFATLYPTRLADGTCPSEGCGTTQNQPNVVYSDSADRPDGVPDSCVSQGPSKKGGGERWVNPDDPNGDSVRVMPGDPSAEHPSQQQPYAQVRKGGKVVDSNGNEIKGNKPARRPEAHIPLRKLPGIFR